MTEGEHAYVEDLIIDLLQDERRSGRKPLFTAEQVAQIIAVACEKPEASAALKPHRTRYWLNAKTKDVDPAAFARDSVAVCDEYRRAAEAHMLGVGEPISTSEPRS